MAEEYKTIRAIGSGHFGDATLVMETKTKEMFVKKTFNREAVEPTELESAEKEIEAMLLLNHANIVMYIKKIEKDNEIVAIILEYCENGDLREKIKDQKDLGTNFESGQVSKWLGDIADGLEYIHRQNVLHRDLKPENIFVTKQESLKIGDFGISEVVAERSTRVKGHAGTTNYIAPEIFNDEEYSYRCDLWSLGVILYELLTLECPFKKPADIMSYKDYEYPPLPKDAKPKLQKIVRVLLRKQPRERPRAGEIGAMLGRGGKLFDIAIAIDCTHSMQPYIDAAKLSIKEVVEDVLYTQKFFYARVAIVQYRDHMPQEDSYVTRQLDFTRDIDLVREKLDRAEAQGGGDAPEAVADALHVLNDLSWDSSRIMVAALVLDAPPHGVGMKDDGFPNGCPEGLDPVKECWQLMQKGIKLYVFGCEPGSIMKYKDLLAGLAHITTDGRYLPLKDANRLKDLTVESTLSSAKKGTIESDVKLLVEELKIQAKTRGQKLEKNELIKQLCKILEEKCFDMKPTASDVNKYQVTYRGELLAKCETLSEMVQLFSGLPSHEITSERIAGYLETKKISLD